MPGLAQTDKFLLSTATVMIGPMADLYNLNPAKHSIGLVKNFQMSLDPSYTELTQGISNAVVMSIRTTEALKASMEVYEYTLRNLAYGAGIDGSGTTYDPEPDFFLSTASITAAAVAIHVAGDVTTSVPVGSFIFLQANNDDIVHIAKVTAVLYSSPDTTITFTGYAVPTDVTYPIGTRVGVVKPIKLGTGVLFQPELAVKVVGVLPVDNAPFTVLLPKVKITKGLTINFDSANFTNLPFEFTPYVQVPTDPFYGDFGSTSAILFPR